MYYSIKLRIQKLAPKNPIIQPNLTIISNMRIYLSLKEILVSSPSSIDGKSFQKIIFPNIPTKLSLQST